MVKGKKSSGFPSMESLAQIFGSNLLHSLLVANWFKPRDRGVFLSVIVEFSNRFGVRFEKIALHSKHDRATMAYGWRTSNPTAPGQMLFKKSFAQRPSVTTCRGRRLFPQNQEIISRQYNKVMADPNATTEARDKAERNMLKWSAPVYNVCLHQNVSPVEASTRHECWHAVWYQCDLGNRFEIALAERNVTLNDLTSVSTYAVKNAAECFAEVGSAIDLGLEVAEPLRLAFLDVTKNAHADHPVADPNVVQMFADEARRCL
jgi:hypothetical protein